MTCDENTKNLEKINDDEPRNFDEAITATGFGKFNIFLYCIASAAGFTTIFEFYSIPFILPAVQCDLNLSLYEKGVINSISIAGMTVSGFFSGYVSDVIGRRKFIIYASLLDTVCGLSSSFSSGFLMLVISKFLGGFIVSGIYSALTSYLSEIHSMKLRADVQLFVGLLYGLGELLLPLLSVGVLTRNTSYHLWTSFELHMWNIFLIICILPSFISGVGFIFLPESPKFLMSNGKNVKALEILQQIYYLNTSCPRNTYPITKLEESNKDEIEEIHSNKNICYNYWIQVTTIFELKYIKNIILVSSMQFLILIGLDTYSLLIPLILHDLIVEDNINNGNKSISVCDILERLTDNGKQTCTVTPEEYQVYIYCMIISASTILIFLISICIINVIGKCRLLFLLGVTNSVCTVGITFSNNIMLTVALSSIIIPFGNIAFNVLIGIVTDMFPSKLRATAVALTMSVGRVGAIFGSFMIPISIPFGCATPSIFTGLLIIVYSFLTFLLPNTLQNMKQ